MGSEPEAPLVPNLHLCLDVDPFRGSAHGTQPTILSIITACRVQLQTSAFHWTQFTRIQSSSFPFAVLIRRPQACCRKVLALLAARRPLRRTPSLASLSCPLRHRFRLTPADLSRCRLRKLPVLQRWLIPAFHVERLVSYTPPPLLSLHRCQCSSSRTASFGCSHRPCGCMLLIPEAVS